MTATYQPDDVRIRKQGETNYLVEYADNRRTAAAGFVAYGEALEWIEENGYRVVA